MGKWWRVYFVIVNYVHQGNTVGWSAWLLGHSGIWQALQNTGWTCHQITTTSLQWDRFSSPISCLLTSGLSQQLVETPFPGFLCFLRPNCRSRFHPLWQLVLTSWNANLKFGPTSGNDFRTFPPADVAVPTLIFTSIETGPIRLIWSLIAIDISYFWSTWRPLQSEKLCISAIVADAWPNHVVMYVSDLWPMWRQVRTPERKFLWVVSITFCPEKPFQS